MITIYASAPAPTQPHTHTHTHTHNTQTSHGIINNAWMRAVGMRFTLLKQKTKTKQNKGVGGTEIYI
eukprot:COSAG05_NODE_472_length_9495_cov_29.989783_9_plen_67_part_00